MPDDWFYTVTSNAELNDGVTPLAELNPLMV